MRVSILGTGSIGSVFAASLASTDHEIHLHVRGERGARQILEGIDVSGFGLQPVPASRFLFSCEELEVEPHLHGGSDVVIFSCKSYAIPSLLELAQTMLRENGVALAISNGLGHPEQLARALGPQRVLAATTTHGAFTEAEGGVVWVGQGTVNLALPPFGAGEETMALVAELFDVAQLSPVVRDDAASMVWEKVLLNLAINPIAALAGLQNGELLADELLSTCMMVYREAARVARLQRVAVPDEVAFEHHLRAVLTSTKDNHCSMLQDMKAGRRTEIEALNGAVVELAEEHGLAVPLNQMLTALVQACHP